MLRGHGTLKSILGRSVIPSKRKRSSELDDDVEPKTATQSTKSPVIPLSSPTAVSEPLKAASASSSWTVAEGDESTRCPICGRRFNPTELPEQHVGAAHAKHCHYTHLRAFVYCFELPVQPSIPLGLH